MAEKIAQSTSIGNGRNRWPVPRESLARSRSGLLCPRTPAHGILVLLVRGVWDVWGLAGLVGSVLITVIYLLCGYVIHPKPIISNLGFWPFPDPLRPMAKYNILLLSRPPTEQAKATGASFELFCGGLHSRRTCSIKNSDFRSSHDPTANLLLTGIQTALTKFSDILCFGRKRTRKRRTADMSSPLIS